ncbi:hypothetical protein CANARDRAFT_204624 [[Candida] arabinofermentans NRRL YB-2248]|uniref:Phospholipid/glycerol acyltransferase domain-containing protein n=1 Tax=[Candida] arabinofermentans NRRL YB-2248 TaxID=983967 RepID=A0A1E4STB5_9ASCO|nr:hypothetical protein CANARDRAFT_204624 [[Candida] arabinofermentans NRRL YB-2248]
MPIVNPSSKNVLLKYIINPTVVLIKTPFLIISVVLLLILSPIAPLYKLILRLMLLVVFGVSEIELLVDGIKKSNSRSIKNSLPSKGSITLINFSSPLDAYVLYLVAKTGNVTFLSTCYSGEIVEIGGLFDCFKFALSAPSLEPEASKIVKDLSKYSKKTTFLIVEGTTSNNKAILDIPSAFNYQLLADECKENNIKMKVISIKSQPGHTIPTPIPVSPASYVYSNMTSLQLDSKFKMKLFDLPYSSSIKKADLKEKLSNYRNLKLIGSELSIPKKIEFIKKYNNMK